MVSEEELQNYLTSILNERRFYKLYGLLLCVKNLSFLVQLQQKDLLAYRKLMFGTKFHYLVDRSCSYIHKFDVILKCEHSFLWMKSCWRIKENLKGLYFLYELEYEREVHIRVCVKNNKAIASGLWNLFLCMSLVILNWKD